MGDNNEEPSCLRTGVVEGCAASASRTGKEQDRYPARRRFLLLQSSVCALNTHEMPVNYITSRQLSERLGYHQESIRRMVREGRLPAIRIGKRLRFSIAAIEAFETSSRVMRGKEVAP